MFVIDSTDIERLSTAADELAAMLNEDELRDAGLLVFANKQDQPGAKGAGEISEALRLGELRDRNWSIVACSAIDGSGVEEGMDWLVVGRSDDIRMRNVQLLIQNSKQSILSPEAMDIGICDDLLEWPLDSTMDDARFQQLLRLLAKLPNQQTS